MSLVKLYGKKDEDSCRYCKDSVSPKSAWYTKIDPLDVMDYKNLIDCGWRRSGSLCYKPMNRVTCCPAYPIRCKATEFTLSRSQKAVLLRVAAYLNTGINESETKCMSYGVPDASDINAYGQREVSSFLTGIISAGDDSKTSLTSDENTDQGLPEVSSDSNQSESTSDERADQMSTQAAVNIRSRTAHRRRWSALQEKLKKQSQKDNVPMETVMKSYQKRRDYRLGKNRPKQLEEYLNLVLPRGEAKHFLEVRLCSNEPMSPDFKTKLMDEHTLYTNYQVGVHGKKPENVDLNYFLESLVQSPLTNNKAISEATGDATEAPEFGSYHQQYWLDGERLIAVGVIDLLPGCLSSVYLFYDPEFAFLQLGTYSALREIAFIREMHNKYGPTGLSPDPRFTDFEYYYMGFYIHSCVKMRYKAQFSPSYLACSETGEWVAIDECKRRLDKNKYSKFVKRNVISNDFTDENQEFACLLPDSESIRRQLPQNTVFQRMGEGIVVPIAQASKVLQPHLMSIVNEWSALLGPVAIAGQLVVDFAN